MIAVKRPAFVALATISIAVAVPGTAMAATCQAPPGSAGVEQYCEVIPGPGGSQTAQGYVSPARARRGGARARRGASPVVASVRSSLRARGPGGAAVLRLVDGGPATTTSSSKRGQRRRSPATTTGASKRGQRRSGRSSHDDVTAAPLPKSDPLRAVSAALQSFGVAGSGIVWILIAVALVMAAFGLIAFRRRPPRPEAPGD